MKIPNAMTQANYDALKTMSVLYVEDELDTREELAAMLQPYVRVLHVGANGQEGLDLFKAERPDIIVTDIQMPRVSGLAMSADIRSIAPEQLIVFVTAYTDEGYLFQAIELGIDKYLTKPLRVERLLDTLDKMAQTYRAKLAFGRNLVLLEQYKQLVDQSAIVCKFDPARLFTYVNEKLCELSGYAAHELIGQNLAVLDDEAQSDAGVQQALAGRKWSGTLRKLNRTGGRYVVERSLVPIMDEHGTVIEVVCLEVDVTAVANQCH
jgi:PAS domain S-box-containing protein